MNLAVAKEARVFETGNQPQNPRLFAELEVVLKAHQVVAVGAEVFLAQLHHGPGRFAGARITQPHRLHGPESQSVAAAAGKNLDGQAALEVIEFFPLLGFGGFGCQQRVEKGVELGAVHGAVDVVGRALVPAGGEVNPLHVDRLGLHDGRDGVVEGQVTGAGDALDLGAQCV